MKLLLVAVAIVAAAFPASALGVGLVHERNLHATGHSVKSGVFELVGVHWQGPGAVEYRTRSISGRWSAWHVFGDEDALPNRGAETRATRGWRISDPSWTGPSNGFQYRTAGRVARVRAYFVRSPRLPLPTRRVELAGAPPIIPRSGWRADESIRRARPYYADGVHLVIVHHTVNSNSYTKAQSASIVRGIELYHVKSNGWNDIGYNFLVDKYGQIFEGRYGGMTRPVIGAHAQGFNTGSVGIAVIGDYTSTSITPAARAALVSLIAWRLDYAHVDPLSTVVRVSSGNPRYPAGRAVTLKAISGHRDVYPTSCPGSRLYAQLPSIRTAVSQTGLPKLYSPTVTGTIGGPVRFRARLSSAAAWTVTVRDVAGTIVATGTGTGTKVDWTWDATAAPVGRYTWSMTAPQVRAATGAIGTAPAPLALQQLRVAPSIVSPNGDGYADVAKATFRLTTTAIVTATVLDSVNTPIATIFSGRRPAGTQQLTWSANAVPDGGYQLVLVAKAGGKQVQTSTRFWVDRTLANVAATSTAFSPNGDGRLDTLGLSFLLLNPAHVAVQILQNGAVLATLLEQDLAAGRQQLTWNGGGLPDGRYRISVTTTDALLAVTQTVRASIDRAPPLLRLVSLSRSRLTFRVSQPGRLVLAVNGRWRRVNLKRAGLIRLGNRSAVRRVTAYAFDLAGNKSRVIQARR